MVKWLSVLKKIHKLFKQDVIHKEMQNALEMSGTKAVKANNGDSTPETTWMDPSQMWYSLPSPVTDDTQECLSYPGVPDRQDHYCIPKTEEMWWTALGLQ